MTEPSVDKDTVRVGFRYQDGEVLSPEREAQSKDVELPVVVIDLGDGEWLTLGELRDLHSEQLGPAETVHDQDPDDPINCLCGRPLADCDDAWPTPTRPGTGPVMAEPSADYGALDWALSLALARYCYGDREWSALDPEERNAIAEPYLPRAHQIAPMVVAALEEGGGWEWGVTQESDWIVRPVSSEEDARRIASYADTDPRHVMRRLRGPWERVLRPEVQEPPC